MAAPRPPAARRMRAAFANRRTEGARARSALWRNDCRPVDHVGRDRAHRLQGRGLLDFFPMDRRRFRGRARSAKQLIEIYPNVPAALSRLPELSNNLFFSWHRPTRA